MINAGDGAHEHPTQALLDALTIRRHKGGIAGLTVAICGDIAHSRVARSNILLLNALGARVRVVGPSTLLPAGIERLGVEVFTDMRAGLAGADIVMMLRLQRERMDGSFVPSVREYFHFFGLDAEKLAYAKPDALVMHPGPDEPRRRDRLGRRRRPAEPHPRAGRDGRRRAHGRARGARRAPAERVSAPHDRDAAERDRERRRPPDRLHQCPRRRPSRDLDAPGAVIVADRRIVAAGPRRRAPRGRPAPRSSTAAGAIVAPGLVDMRVFVGEPGAEHRETFASAGQAAAAGGVTTIVTMPDTDPVIDDVALVDFIARRARDEAEVRVYPDGGADQGPRRPRDDRVRAAPARPARSASPTAAAPSPMPPSCAAR